MYMYVHNYIMQYHDVSRKYIEAYSRYIHVLYAFIICWNHMVWTYIMSAKLFYTCDYIYSLIIFSDIAE